MNLPNRRVFVRTLALVGGAVLGGRSALSADAAKVQESDPQAQALGYRDDTTRVDATNYPKHTPQQDCGNCQLYQGKVGDAAGPCLLFGGKQGLAK